MCVCVCVCGECERERLHVCVCFACVWASFVTSVCVLSPLFLGLVCERDSDHMCGNICVCERVMEYVCTCMCVWVSLRRLCASVFLSFLA